jgi:hypothetical protein
MKYIKSRSNYGEFNGSNQGMFQNLVIFSRENHIFISKKPSGIGLIAAIGSA